MIVTGKKTIIGTCFSSMKNEQSSFSLSYLGDSYYELWCRQVILQRLKNRKQVHKYVVQWVRCQTQSRLVKIMMPYLTLEEKKIFRQGRNSKVFSIPKHASTREYRSATGFECLVGFWYLGKDIKRFEELMSKTEVQEYLESVLSVCKNSFFHVA